MATYEYLLNAYEKKYLGEYNKHINKYDSYANEYNKYVAPPKKAKVNKKLVKSLSKSLDFLF